MTDTPVQAGMMTIDEFIRRYDQEGPFEIIDGGIVEIMPTVFGHNITKKRFYDFLSHYAEPLQLGEVFSETPFILPDTYSPNWVKGSRVPDVMFLRANRLAAYKASTPDFEDLPLMIVPDLVVEVVSPNDSYTEIDQKVERYLSDGVQLVWVMDPQQKKVSVHVPNSKQQTNLSSSDLLTGGAIIPGFEITVASIFE